MQKKKKGVKETLGVDCLPPLRFYPSDPAGCDLQSLPHARGGEEVVFLLVGDGEDAGEPVGEEGGVVGHGTVGREDALVEPGGGGGGHAGDEVGADFEEVVGGHVVELGDEVGGGGRGGGGFGGLDCFFFGEGDVVDAVDVAGDVAVEGGPGFDSEAGHAHCFEQAAAVGYHLRAVDVEERAVLHEVGLAEVALGVATLVVHDHAEFAVAVFDCSADHEAVPGFEDVEEGRHGGEAESADEEWHVFFVGHGDFFGCSGFGPFFDQFGTELVQ